MEYQEKSTLSSPDDAMLPEVYTDTVACIYNVDGKCKGMLTAALVLVTPTAAKTQTQQTNVGGWVLRSGMGQLRETGSTSVAPPINHQ